MKQIIIVNCSKAWVLQIMETDHWTREMATQFSNRADFKYS